MKIIDALWEKRNLDVTTIEIIVEEEDTLADVENTLRISKADYVVIKIPTIHIDLLWLVQEQGYLYVEDMMRLVSDLSELQYSPIIQRMRESITYELINEQDFSDK